MADDPDKATPEDVRLLAELRSALGRVDPVPDEVVSAARGSFTWRTIDAELAQLTYDSALDENALVGVRTSMGSRLLSFEAASVTIEVSVEETPSGRRLVGQLAPPRPATIAVRSAGRTIEARADDLGRFAAEGVEPGPLSVRVDFEDGRRFETEWLTL